MSVYLKLYARIKAAERSAAFLRSTGKPQHADSKMHEAARLRTQLKHEIDSAGLKLPQELLQEFGLKPAGVR